MAAIVDKNLKSRREWIVLLMILSVTHIILICGSLYFVVWIRDDDGSSFEKSTENNIPFWTQFGSHDISYWQLILNVIRSFFVLPLLILPWITISLILDVTKVTNNATDTCVLLTFLAFGIRNITRSIDLLIACYKGLKYSDNTQLEKYHCKSTNFATSASLFQLLCLNILRYPISKTLSYVWYQTITCFIISIVCDAITNLFVDYELCGMKHKYFTHHIHKQVYDRICRARDRQKRKAKNSEEEQADVDQPLV